MKKTLILFIAMLLCAEVAIAWNGRGHQTIVALAEKHLTKKARKNIDKFMPYELKKEASWMDKHRRDKEYAFTGKWHSYEVNEKIGFVHNPDKRASTGNAIYALTLADYNLTNWKDMPDSTVIMNLRMLLHFVGDMHCPCHVNHSYERTPKGKVTVGEKAYSYHRLYDSSPSLLWKDHTTEQIVAKIDHLKKSDIEKLTQGNFQQWANECGKNCAMIYDLNRGNNQELDPNTLEKSRKLIISQLQKAGYRLASLLNRYFGE
ncbi:MAG: S1/P1 nuclease [Alistipes sp.]|nr:S1/P1 nuclease [Candidatus Alistipes equi]